MPSINDTKHEEAVEASWEATRGAIYGAAKWGLASALIGGVGYAVSPLYRGLTIQFKVYVPLPKPHPHLFSCCFVTVEGGQLMVVADTSRCRGWCWGA